MSKFAQASPSIKLDFVNGYLLSFVNPMLSYGYCSMKWNKVVLE